MSPAARLVLVWVFTLVALAAGFWLVVELLAIGGAALYRALKRAGGK